MKIVEMEAIMEKLIIALMSSVLSGRDWHKLSMDEEQICNMLITAGYINEVQGGFVGHLTKKAQDILSGV